MSWDVVLYKFSRIYRTIDEITPDEQPHSLGSLKDVQTAVSSVFPATNWDDAQWGTVVTEFGSIEFNVGKEDPVQGLALHVRAGEAVIPGILQLCERLNCQAIDTSAGNFLEQAEQPEKGLQQWRQYRDRVVGNFEA
jgi:hypothetical protein